MDKIKQLDEKIERIRFYKLIGKTVYIAIFCLLIGVVLWICSNSMMMQKDTLNTLNDQQQEMNDLSVRITNVELLCQSEEKTVRNENDELTAIYTQAYSDRLDKGLIAYTVDTCLEWGVEPSLVFAVMETESNFDINTKSDSSIGLMQINKINSEWLEFDLGVTDLYDPYENILSGVYILSTLNYDTLEQKLMAYNMGASRAEEKWSKGIHSTDYTEKVISRMI